jgi:ABC-type Zn2+ transport system substrate-binding protein/surface adhesin
MYCRHPSVPVADEAEFDEHREDERHDSEHDADEKERGGEAAGGLDADDELTEPADEKAHDCDDEHRHQQFRKQTAVEFHTGISPEPGKKLSRTCLAGLPSGTVNSLPA